MRNQHEAAASDGTPQGTVSLQPPGLFNLEIFPTDGPVQYFKARDGEDRLVWWRTDGTAAGTFEVARNVELLAAIGYEARRQLFFAIVDDTTTPFDAEPWVSDGTVAGTRLLKDLNPGPDGASASRMVPFGSKLYFRGPAPDDGSIGVWETDGTPAGTRFVVDHARDLWSAGSSLYLLRRDGNMHLILHKSDGTPEDPCGSLTDRERKVLHLVVEGQTTKEVAQQLRSRSRPTPTVGRLPTRSFQRSTRC